MEELMVLEELVGAQTPRLKWTEVADVLSFLTGWQFAFTICDFYLHYADFNNCNKITEISS